MTEVENIEFSKLKRDVVYSLLEQGLTNEEIQAETGYAKGTVSSYASKYKKEVVNKDCFMVLEENYGKVEQAITIINQFVGSDYVDETVRELETVNEQLLSALDKKLQVLGTSSSKKEVFEAISTININVRRLNEIKRMKDHLQSLLIGNGGYIGIKPVKFAKDLDIERFEEVYQMKLNEKLTDTQKKYAEKYL